MKPVASYGIVNAETSGPGAFLRAAKWYWDELTDMFAAAGFGSLMIPMVPNTENVSRNGAPICTASIRTRFGSPAGYRRYLNDKGLDNVEAIGVSAQSQFNSLFETGGTMDTFFDGMYAYALDAAEALKELGGSVLLVSPTPGLGFLHQSFGRDEACIARFQADAAACLNRLGETCKSLGVNVTFRNEYWTSMRGTGVDAFCKELDASLVTYAPDPAHLAIAGADSADYFKRFAAQAKAVCFTDTRFTDPDGVYDTISPELPQDGEHQRVYWDLGFGGVDFEGLWDTLKAAGFDGPVLLESRYSTDIPRAILRMRTFWNRLEKRSGGKEAK